MIYSESESRRFNARIFRDKIGEIKVRDFQQNLIDNNVDIAIIRIPSEKLDLLSKLDIIGFPFIVADTLVYYDCKFDKYEPQKIRNTDIEFVKCNSNHSRLIEELTGRIFPNYTSHYNSNSILEKNLILEGYKEWASGYVNSEGKIAFLVKRNGEYIGFATCSWDNTTKSCEGVLYGVKSEHSGCGVYSDIIRFTQDYFKQLGFERMFVSTQIQNVAVQKVWAREGFSLLESYNTIHINSLLDKSNKTIETEKIEITDNLIQTFGGMSKDWNPIHFDDNFAREKGFDGRIAHGLIPSSIISKYFGTQFPGVGTVFINYKYLFYKPLYLNQTYTIKYQFPDFIEYYKVLLAVVKVVDSNNQLCLISYNHLIKK